MPRHKRIRTRVKASLLAPLGLFGVLALFVSLQSPIASAATSSNLNFQARLLTSTGAVVADGTYNLEFKIYDSVSSGASAQGVCSLDSSTDDCWWIETRTGANKVRVVNGYLSVNLGSVTAFGSTIPWDQTLYFTMNIGGTGAASFDGEMLTSGNRMQLTGIPYAFRAGALAKFNGTQTGTLSFNTVANSPVITLPDATGTVCLQSSSSCGFLTSTTGVQLQGSSPGSQQTGHFNISGTGIVGTALQSPLVLTADQTAGSTSSTAIVVRSGDVSGATSNSGAVTLRSGNSSTSGNTGAVSIKSGNATSGTAGDVTIDTGTTTTGTPTLNLGNTNAKALQIGNNTSNPAINVDSGSGTIAIGTGAQGRTVNIATGAAAQVLTLGSSSSTSSTSIQSGTGNISLTTNGSSASVLVKSGVNSTSAFQVQNSSGIQMLNVDSTNPSTDITTGGTANLVTNGSFEVNTTGWAARGSSTLSQSSLQQYIGGSSLSIATTTAANDGAKYNLTTTSLSTNAQYTLSLWARSSFGNTMSTFEIGRAEDGSTDTNCLTAQTLSSTGWTKFTCSFTTGTTSGTPYIYVKQTDAPAAGRTIYIDGVLLSRYSLLANPSIEASLSSSNWQSYGTPTTHSRITSDFQDQSASLQVTTQATANQGTKQNITLNDSTAYRLSFYAKGSGTALTTMEAGYASDGSTDTSCITAQTVSTSSWTQFTCRLITPSSHSSTPYIYIKNTAATVRTWFVDNVQLTAGNPTTVYGEGKIAINGVVNSPLILQAQMDSTSAFQIQNSAGASLFTLDSQNSAVVLGAGDTATPSAFTVRGAAASGNNIAGANLTFDASNGTGAGGSGDLIFRTAVGSGGVQFDKSTTGNDGAGGGSSSIPNGNIADISITSGHTNNLLIVEIVLTTGTQTVSTVSYNSVAMTQLATQPCASNNCRVDLWYLVNPTADGATHGLTATLSGSTNWQWGASSYYNVNQTTPLTTATTNSGTTVGTQTFSNNITSTSTGQVPLDGVGANQTLTMVGANQTQRFNAASASSTNSSNGNSTSIGTTSMQWSGNSASWGWIGTTINPSSNSIVNTLTDRLHITAAGNVGIGTTSPTALLQVAGSALFNVTSTTAFQIQDGSANPLFVVDSSSAVAKITIGPISTSNPVLLVLGNKSNSTADPTITAGAIYYNSSSRSFRCGVATIWVSCVGGLLSSNTGDSSAIANTTTETPFSLNYQLPASYCVAGRVIRWTAAGQYSTTGTPTMVFKLRTSTPTTLATSPTITAGNGAVSRQWRIQAETICNSAPGASIGTNTQGTITLFTTDGQTQITGEFSNTGNTSLATNAALTLQVSLTWGTANAANTATMRQFLIEGIGP